MPDSHTSNSTLTSSYRHIIALALPVMLANVAVPIQGLIDTALVGNLGSAAPLAGLGISTQVMMLILVSLNFLQYATSGLSAQALGTYRAYTEPLGKHSPLLGTYSQSHTSESAKARQCAAYELLLILLRALSVAAVFAAVILAAKPYISSLALALFEASSSVNAAATTYLDVRLWGVFFELANYALIGWFAGQAFTKLLLLQQLIISLVNIALSITFVTVFDFGITGIAAATVTGHALGFLFSVLVAKRIHQRRHFSYINTAPESSPSKSPILKNRAITLLKDIAEPKKLKLLFALNANIFIRTLLLTLSFAWLTRLASLQGTQVLAANMVLLQILYLSAFALDGVAVVAESLTGQALGAQSTLKQAIVRTGLVSYTLAGLLSLGWWLGFAAFVGKMTNVAAVIAIASSYKSFAILLPLVGAGAYWLDGVFFGLTAGRLIRNAALMVAMVFFPVSWLLADNLGNTGVWLSIWLFLLLRLGALGVMLANGLNVRQFTNRNQNHNQHR